MGKAATLAGLLGLGIAFLASAGSDAMVAPPAASGPALAGSTTVETVALRKRGAQARRSALARKAALKRAIAAKNRQLAKARAVAAKNRHAATKSRGAAVTSRHAAAKSRAVAIKKRQAAVAKRNAAAKTRQAAVANRSVAVRKSQGAASPVNTVGRGNTRDVRTTMVERPIRPWVPQPYYGVVIAGVTLGTVVAATTVPPSPTFDLCWYWSNPPKTRGYWDYCN